MKKLCLMFFVFVLLFSSSFAEIPNAPNANPIQDFADILSPTHEMIIESYADILSGMDVAQLVVVTVNSLDGMDIEDYSLRLFNSWGIGSYTKNDGILILFAPNERFVHLSTGIGISHILGSSECEYLLDNFAIEHFKNNDYANGLIELSKATCIKASLMLCPIFDNPELVKSLIQ